VITQTRALSGSAGYVNNENVEVTVEASDTGCYSPGGLSLWMTTANDRTDCDDENKVGPLTARPYQRVLDNLNDNNPAGHFIATRLFPIPIGDGEKAICVAVRNPRGRETGRSRAWGFNIVLDKTQPTVPGAFRKSACTKSGNDRTVTLAWDASSDTNFAGYRLYRKINTNPFTEIRSTTGLTATDTTLITYDQVLYVVRAYDKAGNVSEQPIELVYNKHDC
jgi:hypothetical protein